jgi:hypothetical protein
MIVNTGFKVEIRCNLTTELSPVTFCKCEACVEARKIHRKHEAVLVEGNAARYEAALAWREAQKRRAAKKVNAAWHALKEAEKSARRAGPFNGLRGIAKLAG